MVHENSHMQTFVWFHFHLLMSFLKLRFPLLSVKLKHIFAVILQIRDT